MAFVVSCVVNWKKSQYPKIETRNSTSRDFPTQLSIYTTPDGATYKTCKS